MSIKDTVVSAVGGVVSIFTGLSQAENQRSKAPKVITPGMPELLRSVAAQGAVLLKNDGVLPLKKDSEVALFGRVQKDWFFTGYGSGGDVTCEEPVFLYSAEEGNLAVFFKGKQIGRAHV